MYNKDYSPRTLLGLSTGINENVIRPRIQSCSGIYIASVLKAIYPDDPDSETKTIMEYNIRIDTPSRRGYQYNNVPFVDIFGGVTNFSQIILHPKEKVIRGETLDTHTSQTDCDSSIVLVTFIGNNSDAPIIIGGVHHDSNFGFTPKREDGERQLSEFNGIRYEINKDGELILTYFGGARDTKTRLTERKETAPTIIKIDKDGVWNIEDKEKQKIEVNRVTQTISIEQKTGVKLDEQYPVKEDGALLTDEDKQKRLDEEQKLKEQEKLVNQLVLDKLNTLISLVSNNDNPSKITIDGKNGNITIESMGKSKMKIDGQNGKIELGANGVELLAEIINELEEQIQELKEIQIHTHIGNLGYETLPPSDAAKFKAIEDKTKAIQDKIKSIKGTL